jgi:hypothetical protein
MKNFDDTVYLYFSEEDGCWIAHSLRTDQVGTGIDMGRALADLIRAVDQVVDFARQDKTIQIFCDAPKEVQDRAALAKPLPLEIFEIAHRIARGQWPDELAIVSRDEAGSFVGKMTESVC